MDIEDLTKNDKLKIAEAIHLLKKRQGLTEREFEELSESEQLQYLEPGNTGTVFICGKEDVRE